MRKLRLLLRRATPNNFIKSTNSLEELGLIFFLCALFQFLHCFFLKCFNFVYLLKWLVDHPEFISSPFYVVGDSYAGHIVPGVVHQISLGTLTYHLCLFQSFSIF